MKGNSNLKAVKLIFAAFVFGIFASPGFAASISLAWDPSPSTNVTGYTVYYGHTSGNYSTQVDAENQTNLVVQGIDRRINYFFAVTARTSDGLESLPSNEVNLPPENNPPQVAISSPVSSATFATTNASINLGGTASDDYGLAQITWSNQCNHASGVASGTTSWTVANVALCVGTNILVVTARDVAGNSSSDTITIVRTVLDTISPQVVITGPSSSVTFLTTNASVILSGSASDASGVTQTTWSNQCSQTSGVAVGTTSWTVANVSLCVGTNILVVTARDAAGNSSSDAITIIRTSSDSSDTTSPQLVITSPTSFATFSTTNASVNLGGTASDASGVTQVSWSNQCSHASGVASGTTSWTVANVFLCFGTNIISIAAKDASGNVGTDVITIVRNQPNPIALPQVTITSPGANFVTTDSTIDFTGTASGGLSIAEVGWSNRCSHATGIASGTTSWTVSDVALCLGTNIISFTVRDTAGNLGNTAIAIVRNGHGCGYAISATVLDFDAAGGSGSVSVTAGAACDWTSASSSDWIKITSGFSGAGNGLVSFGVDPNNDCSPRNGVLLIAGQNFTVTQAAGTVAIDAVSGTFNGLFTVSVPQESPGLFTLKKGTRTGFTGSIKVDGKQYSFSGKFDSQGLANTQIRRAGTNALSLELSLEPCSPDVLSAALSDGNWNIEFSADRSAFNAKTEPAPYAGQYTIAVAGVAPEASLVGSASAAPIETSPEGIGFATVRVLPNGLVKVTGNVGDGERLAQSGFLSKDGLWSCYVPLYKKAGLISGSLTFQTGEVNPRGTLNWIKPAISTHKFYPAGFSKSVAVIGSPYCPPASRTNRVLNFSNGTIIIDGNNPAGGLAKDIILLPENRIVPLTSGEDRLSFRINKGVGTFAGTIKLPGHTRRVTFRGGLLQNQNAGYGLFLSTNQSGQLLLEPTP